MLQCFSNFFDHLNLKKTASKVAHNRPKFVFSVMPPAQIQLKSKFLFHKNLPPQDFSIMTLTLALPVTRSIYDRDLLGSETEITFTLNSKVLTTI